MPEGACPELWCLDNAEYIQSLHGDYVRAGADIVYTCTFGANRIKLSQHGDLDAYEINRQLALLAREAAGQRALVAGDIAPTGRFVEPFGDLAFDEAVECYKEQVRGLIDGGVDLFVIETMMDIQEARAALIAVREVSEAYTMVTMTYESTGRTLNGTDPVSALITLQSLGADAVGCNCSTGPDGMVPFIRTMKPYATVPLVAKPNAGLPRLKDGKTFFDMGPDEYSLFVPEFVSAGVNFLGGCCGTTPAHIQAVKDKVDGLVPQMSQQEAISALSSARKTVVLVQENPLTIIGERINPTGKKALQQELIDGKMSLVRKYAREQTDAGADIVDVNVGMPGIDEVKIMTEAIRTLSVATDAPLCIDSSRKDAIEAALRLYPGRALINSISGEEPKCQELLKIAAKYGAMFILLPLAGRKIPKTSNDRQVLIEDIFNAARAHGFTKKDIIVDALTMAVSADPSAAYETLETCRWCSREFKCLTVMGLSNVSFGLPERKWINAAFVAMAIYEGLNLSIANPMSEEFMNAKRSSDVLTNRDKQAKAFIDHFISEDSAAIKETQTGADTAGPVSAEQQVYDVILEGHQEEISHVIDAALAQNIQPQALVSDSMIPAIWKVGDLYEKKIYFLPQLIASAETMKKGFEYLDPHMSTDERLRAKKGRIVLATVKGDIHDIGKNIIALLLKNHGFDVIDLGKDVPSESICEAIRKYEPDIVGLSALMTTTMANMDEAIVQARNAGFPCKFMVGGAVVTQKHAQSIGAHYAKDGVEAVKVAETLVK